MDMVISAGKSRKNVEAFVLIPPDASAALKVLNANRKKIGIRKENVYLFPRLTADTPICGQAVLREISNSCADLEHPERMRSRGLRKYVATITQVSLYNYLHAYTIGRKNWMSA